MERHPLSDFGMPGSIVQQAYLDILNDIIHNKDIKEEIGRLAQNFLL